MVDRRTVTAYAQQSGSPHFQITIKNETGTIHLKFVQEKAKDYMDKIKVNRILVS